MKIVYDGVGDTLGILISGKLIVCAEEHGAVVLNYGKDGKPVEIEILNAGKFMGELFSTLIKAKSGEKQLEISA